MKTTPVLIRNIAQKDNHRFTIEWSDGKQYDYRLSELQAQCPCAACVDEETGQRRVKAAPVNSDVRAVKLSSVGRYALRIQFTAGCSNGIYNFDFLRKLAQ